MYAPVAKHCLIGCTELQYVIGIDDMTLETYLGESIQLVESGHHHKMPFLHFYFLDFDAS